MIFASFLIQWWQNILFHLPQSVSITEIPPCPRRKSCWFWYFFMIQAIVVWSISIKKRSASICDTSFQRLSLITVLWSWKKRLPSPWLCLSKKVLLGKCTGISFVDSTPLRICKNQRIHIHKTFKGIAQRGKCSMGWFFGFKLHLICNECGVTIKTVL